MRHPLRTAYVGLLAVVGASAFGSLSPAVAAAQTTTTTPGTTTTTMVSAPPVQGAHAHPIVVYVDTVTGGGTPKPNGLCLEENQFVQGQTVVFRMWADDSSAGGLAVTDRNAKAAYVTIPGLGKLVMVYRSEKNAPAYWEVPWFNTKTYPVGVVNFTVTVVAKPLDQWSVPALANSTVPAQAGIFSQAGWPTQSDLTIVAP